MAQKSICFPLMFHYPSFQPEKHVQMDKAGIVPLTGQCSLLLCSIYMSPDKGNQLGPTWVRDLIWGWVKTYDCHIWGNVNIHWLAIWAPQCLLPFLWQKRFPGIGWFDQKNKGRIWWFWFQTSRDFKPWKMVNWPSYCLICNQRTITIWFYLILLLAVGGKQRAWSAKARIDHLPSVPAVGHDLRIKVPFLEGS